jgi:outer membrane cobalamin receptor
MDVEKAVFMQKRWFFKMNVCLAGACLVSGTTVSAQAGRQRADTVRLPDVEVVAPSRTSVTRQTAPLQMLDGQGIRRLGLQELSDAVRRFSGVTVKDYGGIGGLKTVSVRSLGAHHTGVSYDGVPVSDVQSGQVDISRFTLDNVETVSLSTGPGDDIFQTARMHASAGALHIRTRMPHFADGRATLFSAKIRGGSFGLLNPVLSYGRKLSRSMSAAVCADYMRADGRYPHTLLNGTVVTRERRVNSDIATFRLEGNLYGDFGRGGGKIEAKLYAFHSERGLPGSVKFYNKTAAERLWNDNSFAQARYENRLNGRFTVQAVAKYAYARTRYRDVDDMYAAGYREDRNTQHEYYTSAGLLYAPPSGRLSASLATDYARAKLNSNFLNAVRPVRNTSLTAFAVRYGSRSLTATGSLLGTYIADEVSAGDRPADRRHLSPAVAFSWQPAAAALRLRVSYKDIFRAPTFTDLYYLRMGNTGLRPETARQFNAGLTWSGSIGRAVRYLSLSADAYRNKVEDKIVAIPTLYIWRMMNMGEVEIRGADVNLSAEILLTGKTGMIVSGNYTYQHAIDVTDAGAKNYRHQIPYTPRHVGNASVTFETPRVGISYLLTVVGERYALPQNTAVNRIGAYAEQSIALNRTFTLNGIALRVQGELLNLADAHYDVIQYYPMPGRSWRLSVTLNI